MQSVAEWNCRISPPLAFIAFITLRFISPVAAGVNFTECLKDLQSKYPNSSTVGGVDNNGFPVPAWNATALTYAACKDICGSSPQAFSWPIFSQQFSSWLLPWLALLSQLPYGAHDGISNLMVIFLTVGSPVLAAYSLFITVLNSRWIRSHLAGLKHGSNHRAHLAARVLHNLQQVPIIVKTRIDVSDAEATDLEQKLQVPCLAYHNPLHALVSLPENKHWWIELHDELEYPRAWSNIAICTMLWVLIAYLLTVTESLTGDIFVSLEFNGQGIGSLWLWLLTIVLSWLKISPRIPRAPGEIGRLVKRLNKNCAFVLDSSAHGPRLLEGGWAISVIDTYPDTEKDLFADEACSAPIYNYARLFRWTAACQIVRAAFKKENLSSIDRASEGSATFSVAGSGVSRRILIASAFSLLLQWGTAGSAVMVVWFTPTTGLGCRSLSYLIYASMSTFIWLLILSSSVSSHLYRITANRHTLKRIYKILAILLRYTGNLLAIPNTLLVILSSSFQFSGVFDNCYCDSSVMGNGPNTFDVIIPTNTDGVRSMWGAGLAIGLGSVALFLIFLWLLLDTPLEQSSSKEL